MNYIATVGCYLLSNSVLLHDFLPSFCLHFLKCRLCGLSAMLPVIHQGAGILS